MTRTLQLKTRIPDSREVMIRLPQDIPSGDARILVEIISEAPSQERTLRDLGRSEYFGMWRDRSDIPDSVEFARELRETAWSRSTE